VTITPQCRNGRHAVCNGAVAGDECDCECHDNPTPVRVEVAPRSPDGVPAVVLVRNGLPDQVLYPCRVITCDREFPTEQGEKVHFARAHPDKLAEDVIPPPPPGPDSLLAQQMERDAQERAVVRDGKLVNPQPEPEKDYDRWPWWKKLKAEREAELDIGEVPDWMMTAMRVARAVAFLNSLDSMEVLEQVFIDWSVENMNDPDVATLVAVLERRDNA